MKANTKVTVVMCCQTWSTTPSSGNFQQLLPTHKACGLSISQLKKLCPSQAIQAAIFFKQNASKKFKTNLFKFLCLLVTKKNKGNEKLTMIDC